MHVSEKLSVLRRAQTVSALYTFYLAMTLFPDIQRKAQDEIDRVIGSDRLPELADRHSLPYVSALQSEIYRWRPVGRIGSSQFSRI
jgi:cytochrome P450